MTEGRFRPGLTLVRAAVLLSVALVPLLVNPFDRGDPFYGVKARAVQGLAGAIALGLIMMRGSALHRRVPWRPLAAFGAAAALATAFGVDPRWSLHGAPWRQEGLLTLLGYILIYAGTAAVVSEDGEVWITAVLTGAGAVALLGIAQFVGWDLLPRDAARSAWRQAYSTTGNPNWLGAYVVLVAPLAAAALGQGRRRALRIAGGLSLPVLFLAGVLTLSRTTWAVLALGLAAWLLWVVPRASRRSVVAASGLVILVLGLAVGGLVLSRLRPVFEPYTGPVSERRYLWVESARLMLRRPILGYGPEAFPLVFPQAWSEEKRRIFGPEPLVMDKAHNETLDMTMSVGLLGTGAFYWIVVTSLRGARRGRPLAAGCAAGAVAYLIHLQVHFSVVSVAPIFWSILGATYGEGGRGPGAGGAEPGTGGMGARTANAATAPP